MESTGRGPRLEPAGDELTVFFDRYLYSRHQPARRSVLAAQSVPIIPHCLYILCSPLLGYGVGELLKRIPDNSHVLGIETSQELFGLCTPYLSPDLINNPQFSIFRLSEAIGLLSVLSKLGLWRFRKVCRVDLNNGSGLYPVEYSNLMTIAQNTLIEYWRNRNTLGVLGRQWVRHLFANLANIGRTVPFPAGKPVIVVGAGPSLDTAMPLIVQMRNKLTVLAVDTAFGAFLANGIVPDIVCVVETQSWNHLDFHNSAGLNFILLGDLTSYPGSLKLDGRPVIPFISEFAPLSLLNRLKLAGTDIPHIPPLGSVSLAAVHLVLLYTNGPVFLAGLDFAYTPGKTHGRGTSMHTWQLTGIKRTDPSPGWCETMRRPRCKAPIQTDRILVGYADMFRNNFSYSDRLFMISGGLDLGIPHVSRDQIKSMITETSESVSYPKNQSLTDEERQRRIDVFLRDEFHLLEQAIEAWDNYSLGRGAIETVVQCLKSLDHIYCHFPDKPPLPKPDNVFLARAITQCRELYNQ